MHPARRVRFALLRTIHLELPVESDFAIDTLTGHNFAPCLSSCPAP